MKNGKFWYIRMLYTAKPVTTETPRSMDADYMGGLKVQRHQQMQIAKNVEAVRTKEEAKLVAKAQLVRGPVRKEAEVKDAERTASE